MVQNLELAEAGELTPEAVVQNTQAALLFVNNASLQFSAERRKMLLQQLNPKLKNLMEDSNFSVAPPMPFSSEFGKIPKEMLEASYALKNVASGSNHSQYSGGYKAKFFWKDHSQIFGTSSSWGQGSGRSGPHIRKPTEAVRQERGGRHSMQTPKGVK